MKLKMRILGVLTCLLAYAGTIALNLYNAARYKEVAYLNGGHLYTNWYSVYDIPEAHCIDGLDIFSACIWPMLLMLPLFLYFAVRRDALSRWYKILIVLSADNSYKSKLINLFNYIYANSVTLNDFNTCTKSLLKKSPI